MRREDLRRELRLARAEIRTGHFQRTMAVLAAFAAIVSGFEAYMQHLRGAFAHWLMWTPVVLTPPVVIAAGAALFSRAAARTVLLWASLAALVDGVVGFVFHLRGVRRLPGGFKLGVYNVVMGPPLFAPLLMCTVGVLGVFAALLRREQLGGPVAGQGLDLAPLRLRTQARSQGPLGVRGLERQIAHGRFQRIMALLSAGLAVLAGGEAYFEHLRGSFNQRWMWTPVWLTPPMVAAAAGAARSPEIARRVLPFASAVTFFDGLLGFVLHLRGIKRMPGGFGNLQFNLTLGPPLFAPLLFTAVGLLGFIASLLRRGED